MTMQMLTKPLFLALMFWVGISITIAQTPGEPVDPGSIEALPFDDLPPSDEVGKCYAKCKAPDQYADVTKKVLVKEEAMDIIVTPATYTNKNERVLVKEGGVDYKVVPATYKTVMEKVLVEPEKVIKRTIPAEYRTETNKVLVSPARGEWVRKLKDPNCFSENSEDCFIMCYEEVPAEYRTETKQVLVKEAQTVEDVIPAKYEMVAKRVIDQPARTIEVPIEPVYETVTKKVLVKAEQTSERTIPAVYRDVTERKLVKKGGYTVWTEILCADQTSTLIVRRVQEALGARGYQAGDIDGVMGIKTQTAIKQYQIDNRLPIGHLNIKTLESLGLQKYLPVTKKLTSR